jgi:hypothetical protein
MPTKFGQQRTGDRATVCFAYYPTASKSVEHTLEAFRYWQGKDEKIEQFYSDNALELKSAAREMKWRMPTATPGVP